MGKMIEVEGFKAFRGVMRVVEVRNRAHAIRGAWLYRPDTDCWYCGGKSYPADICVVLKVE